MNDNDSANSGSDGLRKDDALAWSIRMRGEVTEQLQEQFEQWLAASPRHRQAYNRYSRVIAQAEILKSSGQTSEATTAKLVTPSRRWMMFGAAAAAVIVFAITISAGGAPIPGSGVSAHAAEPLVTERGEIRSFELEDGSMATLDSNTRIEVSISPDTRYVRVAHGRARVRVANDIRPFRLAAGQGTVTTNEGVVDVMISDDRQVLVELISGKADLASTSRAASAAAAPQSLRTRTALQYRADDQQVHSTARPSVNSSAEWPSGWAEHRSIPLDQLVSEANRYASVPIIVEDPKLAKRDAAGRFKISDTEMFLKGIADLFDLTIHRRPDGIYLRSQ
ncbi:FecR family protein [Sphingopyxis sp. 22461]|uniref:FecR family protein n=1 Tax=Sphingopyxis sp. 22461 TaxID=3453923 RepID=UPI003F87C59D